MPNLRELFIDSGRYFPFEKKGKNDEKERAVLMGREAYAKEGNYVEIIFDDCGQRSYDRPLRNGVA
jgi:hypothetical protein